MVCWLGLMLLAVPVVAEDCEDWISKQFFANATVEEVVACLNAGADPNERNDSGATALHLAARFNPSGAVIKALLEAGADLNLHDNPGRKPLHLAAWQNPSAAAIKALLEAGADPNEPTHLGFTPLFLAAKAGSTAMAEALIDAGFDLRERGGSGYALVSRGYLGSDRLAAMAHRFRALAAQGNARAQYGLGVIYAEGFGVPQYGVQAAAWYEKAAEHGHTRALTRLEELVSRRGLRPLHLATIRYSSVVAALHDGADPNVRDKAGNAALHLAAVNTSDPAVFEALVEAGADVKARDDFGDTPLHLAARYNTNPAVLAVLIAAGADPNAQGESDASPLHWATWNNGVPAVLTLVNAGADPNARRKDGASPLHWATWNDDVLVLPALLDAGANPDALDASDASPLDWAIRYGNQPAVFALTQDMQLLMSSDFDVYYQKNRNRLIYIKKDCTRDDIRPRFYLHLVPTDTDALPDDRKPYGFDNLDFSFDEHGFLSERQCSAVRELPDYGITTIRSGQYIPGEARLWEAVYHFSKAGE